MLNLTCFILFIYFIYITVFIYGPFKDPAVLESSVMLSSIDWKVVTYVVEACNAAIFRVKQ